MSHRIILSIEQVKILRQALQTASEAYMNTAEYGESDPEFSAAWKKSQMEVDALSEHVEMCLRTLCKSKEFNKKTYG